jgi:hypothetical protein
MTFPSYKPDGSDTYRPPKKYTAEEMRAIRSVARDGQQRFENKQAKPATTEDDNKYGPLVNPQEAEQLRQLKEDNELDNINEALKTIGDSPSTRQIFGR